ncbi:putative Cytochrome P450 [Seiridium cardinale]|uniref:Cytochrome P450 n=1 Tax=Seiridium cardinale TaxID=138064 RepID=A0ABR2XGC5_9PEZI
MEPYSASNISSFRTNAIEQRLDSNHLIWYLVVLGITASIATLFSSRGSYDDGLFTVNKRFSWEPSFFARVRWITNADKIIDAADIKAQGRPYRLARGDTDQIVLPVNMIPELNGLGINVLNSRESHAFGLLGHLTGMGVVRHTSFHVRVLLSYISPALPGLFALTGSRIAAGLKKEFPQSNQWATMKPHKAVVRCIGEAIALSLFGAEMTENNPELVHLTHEHTNNGEYLGRAPQYILMTNVSLLPVFQVCFAMRCVPQFLQPALVWLLPAKWRLLSGWAKFRSYVIPRVAQLKAQKCDVDGKGLDPVNPDVISWMVEDGRNELERDPKILTTLVGSIAAGSTYSITNFCCRTIMDLVAHPETLDIVRREIREKHAEINGRWTTADLASLEKLESAMKESSRLTPGTLLIYSRVVKKDHVLSNGIKLKKGQFVTMSASQRAMDPDIFVNPREYNGLRFLADGKIEEHRSKPFSSINTDTLTWGAGRWACPGRLITDMSAKILLVKLLDEYDFAFVGGKPLTRSIMHEFLFFHPESQMLVRHRDDASGIVFVQ